MSDVDKYINMVFKHRFPEVNDYDDIEKINYEELENF